MFSEVYWNQPVCSFVNLLVYKTLLILCVQLLEFYCDSFENVFNYWSQTEVLREVILKCQLSMVKELPPPELSHFSEHLKQFCVAYSSHTFAAILMKICPYISLIL